LLKFLFYVTRWQLSTPILWIVVSQLGTSIEATVVANLVGASIFFWVDKVIFRARSLVVWEYIHGGECADCGETGSVRRLALAPGGPSEPKRVYDRRNDERPEYRCPACSEEKLSRLAASRTIAGVVQPA
jgi:ribosomal protein L37AE/L43A